MHILTKTMFQDLCSTGNKGCSLFYEIDPWSKEQIIHSYFLLYRINPFGGCFPPYVLACLLICHYVGSTCTHDINAWEKGKLLTTGHNDAALEFVPECFLFQFPETEFRPTIEFGLNTDNPTDKKVFNFLSCFWV